MYYVVRLFAAPSARLSSDSDLELSNAVPMPARR